MFCVRLHLCTRIVESVCIVMICDVRMKKKKKNKTTNLKRNWNDIGKGCEVFCIEIIASAIFVFSFFVACNTTPIMQLCSVSARLFGCARLCVCVHSKYICMPACLCIYLFVIFSELIELNSALRDVDGHSRALSAHTTRIVLGTFASGCNDCMCLYIAFECIWLLHITSDPPDP